LEVNRPHPHTRRRVGKSDPIDAEEAAGQNIDRLRCEGSFAALCGAPPISASSGTTTRHCLDPGGDRQANRALHLIAGCRLRYCERTRAYAKRRTREGKSQREIHHTLGADLAQLELRRNQPATTILCGSPGFGITRRRS
jgi:hypothetical protein